MIRVAYTMHVHTRGCGGGACDGDDLNDEAVTFQHLHEHCYCYSVLRQSVYSKAPCDAVTKTSMKASFAVVVLPMLSGSRKGHCCC